MLAFRDLRLHCGFTKDEREELEGVFEKSPGRGWVFVHTFFHLQLMSGRFDRVQSYLGFWIFQSLF